MDGTIIKGGKMPPLWHHGHEEHDVIAAKTFGFWLYMLSDALLFAGLFAAYAVLDHAMNTAGGPTEAQVVHPIAATGQTLAVLSSVFAYSLATVALKRGSRAGLIAGMAAAAVLGAVFIGLELADFARLFQRRRDPGYQRLPLGLLRAHRRARAAHGFRHSVDAGDVGAGAALRPLDPVVAQLLNLRLFWQFQASVWVCVYVFVYLKGSI